MTWVIHYSGKNTSLEFETMPIGKPEQVYDLLNYLGERDSLEFDYIQELK